MKINIGLNKGNLVGVEIDKKFEDITFQDIIKIVKEKCPHLKKIYIHGWAENKNNLNKTNEDEN